mmetsp:Transcript_1176/g.1600  ORF Transcript_1176/g.1600 Transcript_1176/m.1600 type:complete len:282 (-) Transcript_1176:258-1103(-)
MAERSLDQMMAAIKPPPPPPTNRNNLLGGYSAPSAAKILDVDETYSVGERVWVRDQGEPWAPGVVTEVDSDGHARVMVDDYEEGFYWEETTKTNPIPLYKVGERVFVRDNGEAAWEAGTVVDAGADGVGKPRVLADGYDSAFLWDEVVKTHPGGRLASDVPPASPGEGTPLDSKDGFAVGARVWVRDAGEAWAEGTVSEVDSDGIPRVVQDGLDEAFYWDETTKDTPVGFVPTTSEDSDESGGEDSEDELVRRDSSSEEEDGDESDGEDRDSEDEAEKLLV